ncbi:MAG: hypothetical protein WC499_02655 [Patescibacteria group bacterium]
MVKRFDICIGRKYEKDGEEKTAWNKVGNLVWFQADGEKEDGFKLELPIFGHDKFKVFEQKPKTDRGGGKKDALDTYGAEAEEKLPEAEKEAKTGTETDEIDPNDIPF